MQNDNQRKMQAVYLLAENFSAKISDNMLKMWLLKLKPYEVQEVEQAVSSLIDRLTTEVPYRTMPAFGYLKQELDRITGTPDKPTAVKVSAEREWDNLMNQIERVGSYGNPQLHPTTERVVRMLGGWRTVCMWRNDELQWRMRDFLDLWKSSAANEELLGLETSDILGMVDAGRAGAAKINPAIESQSAKRMEALLCG